MNNFPITTANPPLEQQAIRAKCFHPTGDFVEWKTEDIEKTLAERFEKIVRLYPSRIAIKTAEQVVTYAELNAKANALARAILASRGEEKEPIALLMDNGVDALASLIAALKLGKFFIPIRDRRRIFLFRQPRPFRIFRGPCGHSLHVRLYRRAEGSHGKSSKPASCYDEAH
jgi:non-ribosomal peptide synthetase component F